jgi:hypothetical protein
MTSAPELLFASVIALLSEPLPVSFVLVTRNVDALRKSGRVSIASVGGGVNLSVCGAPRHAGETVAFLDVSREALPRPRSVGQKSFSP